MNSDILGVLVQVPQHEIAPPGRRVAQAQVVLLVQAADGIVLEGGLDVATRRPLTEGVVKLHAIDVRW